MFAPRFFPRAFFAGRYFGTGSDQVFKYWWGVAANKTVGPDVQPT